MATKNLLKSLQFRALTVSLPNVSRITVRYGKEIGVCAGHTAARCVPSIPSSLTWNPLNYLSKFSQTRTFFECDFRKFARNFLPVLLYNNPGIECQIERSEAYNETPGVVVLHSDGKERLYDTRLMAGDTPGRVDRELFRLLAGEGSVSSSRTDAYMDSLGRDKVPTPKTRTGASDKAGSLTAKGGGGKVTPPKVNKPKK